MEKVYDVDEVEREVFGSPPVTDLVAAHDAGEIGELGEVFGVALHLEVQRRPQLRREAMCATRCFGATACRSSASSVWAALARRRRPGQKAFQFRVVATDPYMPNGTELGVERVRLLETLMEQTNTLLSHVPIPRGPRIPPSSRPRLEVRAPTNPD